MFKRLCVGIVLLLGACGPGGGSTSRVATGDTAQTASLEGLTAGHPLRRCARDSEHGPRTDYSTVAEFQCRDGSVPLGGDPARGAAARVGNVGEGPDGHIVDLYEIPCRPTPVRLYIDAYHCPEGVQAETDINNLSPEDLNNVVSTFRGWELDPFGNRAVGLRPGALQYLGSTTQFSISLCTPVMDALPEQVYVHSGLIRDQFIISLGAGVMERQGRTPDVVMETFRALRGVIRMYEVILAQRGSRMQNARMDAFRAMSDDGSLAAHVRTLMAQCMPQPGPGLVMSVDGQNIWPPQGVDCPRLVACCEGNGLVVNGAVVPGGAGVTCMMSGLFGSVMCTSAIARLEEQGFQCPPAPPATP